MEGSEWESMCHWGECEFFSSSENRSGTCCQLLPTHGYDLLEHSALPLSTGRTWVVHCVCIHCPFPPTGVCICVCVCVCVVPEGERAPVQLSGSASDLTRPSCVHMKQRKPRPLSLLLPLSPLRACGKALPRMSFVCQRECTFHTCDHRGGSQSSKLLFEGLGGQPLALLLGSVAVFAARLEGVTA